MSINRSRGSSFTNWWETLAAKTQRIMEEHYERNLDYVMEQLIDNVMWIGAMESQFVVGKDKFYDILIKEKNIPCSIVKQHYHLISGNEYTAVVVGELLVHTKKCTGMILEVKQRVTFQYILWNGVPKVSHLHVSNVWDALEPDEYFPYRAGHQTYQYVQQLIQEKNKVQKKIIVTDSKRKLHVIMESEIIYIQANNEKSIIYYVDGRVEVTEAISSFHNRLQAPFLSVHRSYIINMNYVIGIERFWIRLCDGIQVPVPEKKYSRIKDSIIKWTQK